MTCRTGRVRAGPEGGARTDGAWVPRGGARQSGTGSARVHGHYGPTLHPPPGAALPRRPPETSFRVVASLSLYGGSSLGCSVAWPCPPRPRLSCGRTAPGSLVQQRPLVRVTGVPFPCRRPSSGPSSPVSIGRPWRRCRSPLPRSAGAGRHSQTIPRAESEARAPWVAARRSLRLPLAVGAAVRPVTSLMVLFCLSHLLLYVRTEG